MAVRSNGKISHCTPLIFLPYHVRYKGHHFVASVVVFGYLASRLKPEQLTPPSWIVKFIKSWH